MLSTEQFLILTKKRMFLSLYENTAPELIVDIFLSFKAEIARSFKWQNILLFMKNKPQTSVKIDYFSISQTTYGFQRHIIWSEIALWTALIGTALRSQQH